MDWQTALRRLQNHANLPGHGTENDSFVFALSMADRESGSLDLSTLSNDVLRCLVVMNGALNASPRDPNVGSIPQDSLLSAAYTIAAILSSGLEYARRWRDQARFDESLLRDLELRLWRIALAWEQVLAGDIEDLMEDLALEELARFPKSTS